VGFAGSAATALNGQLEGFGATKHGNLRALRGGNVFDGLALALD
jgi:hypothetical protein